MRFAIAGLVLSLGLVATAAAQQPIRIGAAPQRINTVAPVPPPDATGVTGVVGLEVTVAADGSVIGATVTRSVPALDQSVINAVLQQRYQPTLLNGVPVPVVFNVTVPFPSPVRVGGVVRVPKKITNVDPVYPPELRAAGAGGVAILELLIAPDGTVADTRILKSLSGLDEAAVTAVRQWVFEPTLLNGQPMFILYNVTITFVPTR